jgi:dsRNA-specific ribonuclease
MQEISALQQNMEFEFVDVSLLQRALTHRSYLNENADSVLEDNERLEFLGDAVLDFIVATYLYHHFPEMDEGELTSLRAALVRAKTLAMFARQLDVGPHLRLGHGEAENGGRDRDPLLCAAFEAVVGALYLDKVCRRCARWWNDWCRRRWKRLWPRRRTKTPRASFRCGRRRRLISHRAMKWSTAAVRTMRRSLSFRWWWEKRSGGAVRGGASSARRRRRPPGMAKADA